MNVVYTVAFVIAVTALLTWMSARSRAKGWRGVVTDIQRRTFMKNDVPQEEVVIRYRTDSGKPGKLRLDPWSYAKLFAPLAVGDTLVKVPGETGPKKETAPGKIG
jgi:hypothetical protein